MTGEQRLGAMELSKLSFDEYNQLKIRLVHNSDSDVREAYNIINKLEYYTKFLEEEFTTVLKDYELEVLRSNELHKHLKTTLNILKTRK
jgi:5-methylcytosine-specific restriction endonuclease McrBC GTP-binding regulatory subunit McrB